MGLNLAVFFVPRLEMSKKKVPIYVQNFIFLCRRPSNLAPRRAGLLGFCPAVLSDLTGDLGRAATEEGPGES